MWIGKAVVMDRLCRGGSGLSCAVCSDNGPRQLACVIGIEGPPGVWVAGDWAALFVYIYNSGLEE